MVVLMIALELLFTSIGSAIAFLVSLLVTVAPYALALLPVYLLYLGARAVWPRLRRRFAKPKTKSKSAARLQPVTRKPARPAPLRVHAEAIPAPAKAAAAAPPLARVYGEGLDILKRQMRGALRRGDIPWFLAFGVGGPALLATDPTHVRWPEDGSGELGSWWFCEGAAILHAGADSSDGSKLAASWPGLMAAMRKRPMRRPLDGILLMIGADELRAAAERDAPRAALVKRAAALRERLRALRENAGVVCPVHVVIVRAEALDGFAEFCAGVPSKMLDGVFGWTNPHDWLAPFDPRWVDEALDRTIADVTLLEADAFAAGTAGVRLPLLPARMDSLRHPLALFLGGVLGSDGPGSADEDEPFPLRGIAFTGAHTTLVGGRRPAFARDLLPGRAFAEAGYGRASEGAYLLARRRRRQAQGALAASVVGLSLVAWQGVVAVKAGVPPVAAAVEDLRKGILTRDKNVDPQLVGRLLAATALVEQNNLATPLLPTSLVSGFDTDKRRLASVAVRRAVLRPIRDALLPSAALSDLPPVPNPRNVEDVPSWRRLTDQFDRIADRRIALERYDRFRRSSGFDELSALAASVFGTFPKPPVPATDGFILRITAGADLPNLDAKAIATAVRAESVRLAAPLADELYIRHPLRVRAAALAERLNTLPETPTEDDVAEVRRLVTAVTEAAGWPIMVALRAPALGLPDEIKVALQRAALAELPGKDAAERIGEALSSAALATRAALFAIEAPPVGRFFIQPEDGAPPVLVSAIAALPDALAAALPPPAPTTPPEVKAAPKPVAEAPPPPAPVKAAPVAPPAAVPAPTPPPAVVEAKPPVREPAPAAPPPVTVEAPVVTESAPEPSVAPDPAPPVAVDTAAPVLAKLASSFSQTLAGRFPFVRGDLARGAPDADPEDVRRFYKQLDEARPKLGRDATPEVRAFLDRMEAARPMLDAVARSAVLTVDLTYGVNRAGEVGAEHIIDWSVRSGATAVGSGTAATPLAWKPGQPVLLSFRWAAGSPFRPKSAAASEAAAIAGDTLTVTERGPWALLRLLKGRAAPSSAGQGAVFRMVLPTQTITGAPARDTVLFMAASVKTGSKSSPTLSLPDLPARFPQ
ncbi:type VI secretion system protein [Azospirillum doebereinerae]|nr:type VI secretion system protein [Azospirillum doebereinerae]